MIQFDPVPVGQSSYQLTEITFNDSLKVAVIEKRLNEKRITEFLKATLKQHNPLKLTAQERYLLLLKYMQKQNETMFASDMDFSKYIMSGADFKNDISENGVMVRQLTGRDVEYLEASCCNAAEWIACMMAMQLSYSGHDVLEKLPDQNAFDQLYMQQFMSRLDHIKKLPASEFQQCYQEYAVLNNQLCTHVRLTICNDGLALRGTDDAPVRFCPASCFIGIIRELDRSYSQ